MKAIQRLGLFAVVGMVIGVAPSRLQAQNITFKPVITTVAGDGTAGYNGDNIPATSAELYLPNDAAVDSAGNIYIADWVNQRVRKVNTTGTITTVAGNGTAGYNGDNIAATSAELNDPLGVAVDTGGNLYIADYGNGRIRKVNSSGIISTVAGNGTSGYNGDNIPATSAALYEAYGVAVDNAGNFYIVDQGNQRIRKVNTGGTITTVAGTGTAGYNGDNIAATSAELNNPFGVAVDSAGNLYIADDSNERVRKVNKSGTITTAAGTGTAGYNGDDIKATSAELNAPESLAVDSAGDLYMSDTNNDRVREVDVSGTITTVAGNGTAGYNGENIAAASAELNTPAGIAMDNAGNVYIADYDNYRVRKVTGTGDFGQVNVGSNSMASVVFFINTALTLTSVQASGDYSVTSDSCALNTPLAANTLCMLQVKFAPTKPGQRWFPLVATDSNGNKYRFGLEGVGVGSALAFTPGIITTVAGNGFGAGSQGNTGGSSGDNGLATSAELFVPETTVVDGGGNLYIADTGNNRIRKVSAGGIITTVAGNGTAGYNGDNIAATFAELTSPLSVVVDSAGDLYIADSGNNRIRKVDTNGIITTVAGNGTGGYNGDNIAATSAEIYFPEGMTLDSAGNLYITDTFNERVRRVDPGGIITTVAGNGTGAGTDQGGFSGDGGPATSAELNFPTGVAIDGLGNLYISDVFNDRIRKVNSSGIISTIAGDGTCAYNGDNIPATSAEICDAWTVFTDSANDLYLADSYNNRIRKIDTAGIITTVAGNGTGGGQGTGGYTGDGGGATSAELDSPSGVAVDSSGNVIVADTNNNVIREVNVSRSALAFPNTPVDQVSAVQTIAVSDVGTAALNFNSISVSPNFTLRNGEGDCSTGNALAAGGTCQIGVEFAPTTAGNPLTGTLTAADNAANSPQTAALSGSTSAAGTAPTITSNNSGTFGIGVENSFEVTTTGTPVPSITESGTLPTGVTFVDNGNGTGSLRGIPTTTGSFPIMFSAQNGISPNATQSFTLSVSGEVGSQTLTVNLLGGGAGAVTDDTGVLNCSEANGVEPDENRCLVNYSMGSMVTLTATPAARSGSTFGGWGGACASAGTSPMCTVAMNSGQTVSANFVAAPMSVQLPFTPGTNVVQTAAFNCPGNPNPISPTNPCTMAQGPNATAFEVMLPQVFAPFTMVVTATEFQANGLCPAGGSVTDPTDFDCRFKTFFDYGTDISGNTIVPLCNPYVNGNCIHYDIYYCVPQASGPCVPTPGQEPPPSDYLNLVNLNITWNNDTFVPPSPTYTGSLPRLYDDPDYAFTPTSPFGTICGQPMVNGSTMEPYSCQFEFDVTTFFNPTEPVDAGIGGTIRQFNDLVVAFPPTTPGTDPVVTPTTTSAPTISGSCVVGCTTSSSNVAFVAGMGGAFALTTTGFPAPTLTETGTLPTGLIFATVTGIISGTPAAGTEGSYPITITATNAVSSVMHSYTIIVGSLLSISPASVNFGKVYLDTIAAREVTLTNTGTTSITIGKIDVTAGVQPAISISKSGDFIDLSLCPSTLGAGKKCFITVSFIAQGSDFNPQSATLNITAGGIVRSVLMTAQIIDPVAKLSALSLNFGNQKAGTDSTAKSVTLTNSGKTPLLLSGLWSSGDFVFGSAGTCTSHTSLLEGASCTISVIFEPGSKGLKVGSVKITDNALIGTQYVVLTGNGT